MTPQPMHPVRGFIAAFSQAAGRTPAAASQQAMDYLLREGGQATRPLISTGEFGPTAFERLQAPDPQGFLVPIALAERWLAAQVSAFSSLRGGDSTSLLDYKASYYYGRWWSANYPLQNPDSSSPGSPWIKTFDGIEFAYEAVLRIDLET